MPAVLVVFQLERLLDERGQSFVLVFFLSIFFFFYSFLPFEKAVKIHDVLILYKFAVQV